MSWTGRAFHRAAPVIDVMLAPAVWVAAQTLMMVRRLTPPHAPRAMRVLDRIGLYPLVDHYYEPLINMNRLRHPLDQPRDLPGVVLDVPAAMAMLEDLAPIAELDDVPATRVAGDRPVYHWDNTLFGPLDAWVLHGMVRRHRPRRILEVGCGMSTLVALRAAAMNTADGAPPCVHTCIEPYENPWLAELPVRLVRTTAETADLSLIEELEAGDILFIDSSHMIRPQGDVLTEVLHWLGRLRPGVIVHIHDVFTPRDYPDAMVRTYRFFWNEQYLVEAFLAFNARFSVLLPLHHLHATHPEETARLCPQQQRPGVTPPSSFWIGCTG
ncbi:class I SAM-dependent methyltransferase [Humitalea sp. 24SJ18S-53]|uniref:class I SAM-dependent methyltransferase n=1 Tax=Humitalea sp. 24SJ18S-53 TaxID=3422307 RepID=UPI003D66DE3D